MAVGASAGNAIISSALSEVQGGSDRGEVRAPTPARELPPCWPPVSYGFPDAVNVERSFGPSDNESLIALDPLMGHRWEFPLARRLGSSGTGTIIVPDIERAYVIMRR